MIFHSLITSVGNPLTELHLNKKFHLDVDTLIYLQIKTYDVFNFLTSIGMFFVHISIVSLLSACS